MSLISQILSKLGIGEHDEPENISTTDGQKATKTGAVPGGYAIAQGAVPQVPGHVDLDEKLDKLASRSNEKLDWRNSIVDLLKALDLDSDAQARHSLFEELGGPNDLSDEPTKLNQWLHQEVMRRLRNSGGATPKEIQS